MARVASSITNAKPAHANDQPRGVTPGFDEAGTSPGKSHRPPKVRKTLPRCVCRVADPYRLRNLDVSSDRGRCGNTVVDRTTALLGSLTHLIFVGRTQGNDSLPGE